VKETTVVRVGEREVALTNLNKMMWPDDAITKGDLIGYYVQVAPYLLPYLRERALVFTRYPDGIGGKAFYQKDRPSPAPDWIRTVPVEHKDAGRVVDYVLADEPAALAWIANLACIEIHPWLSSIRNPDNPDFAVFDLDPAEGATFDDVRTVAGLVRQVLSDFGLAGYLKTTGATGLHVFVPVRPLWSYDQVRLTVEFVARLVCKAYPKRVTLERVIERRRGKVYIDYLQNIKGKTLVSIFSPRPRPRAPVSFPVSWADLPDVNPNMFTLRNAVIELGRRGDPFSGCLVERQDLGLVLQAAAPDRIDTLPVESPH
jgi:bifunctional non-homologous end joining protein LigD